MVEQQTTNHDDDIIILEEDSGVSIETIIQNEQIQNSLMDTKPISLFNNDSQIRETPSLLDHTAIEVKKVIISFL